MRTAKKRQPVERLFVLGAGASFAASCPPTGDKEGPKVAPLDSTFTKMVSGLERARPGWNAETRDSVVNSWKGQVPFASIGLEQAVLTQLGMFEFIDSIQPRRQRPGQLTASEWMDRLAHLICAVLQPSREARPALYSKLAEIALPEQTADACRNRVITFNYDTLFDSLLNSKYIAGEIYFDAITDGRGAVRGGTFKSPLLLKLHGSTNWRCRSEDLSRIITGEPAGDEGGPFEIPEVWLDKTGYPDPASEVSPLIVPPMPSKPIGRVKLFRFLWMRAFEYLYEAKDLVVIGYSLPPADVMAAAMFSSFQSSNLERVILVDPSPEVLLRWRRLLRRTGVPKAVRWEYHETLEEFVAQEDA